jgi:ABC-2 type transport system permease protein
VVSTPATPEAFTALYRLVLRQLLTRGRLLLFIGFAAVAILLGWVVGRSGGDEVDNSINLVSAIGLGLIVPVVALVLGSSALGTWVEDETLVYVWLRPVKRWMIAGAATLAAVTIAVPVTVVPLTVMSSIAGGGDATAMVATAVSTTLGGLAYVALFVAFGLVVRRALLFGLIYVFIWEFVVARFGAGAARLSINSYALSLLSDRSGVDIELADRAPVTSYIVLAAVTVVAIALTTWRLNKANVA